jgi:hypothetical protein
MKHMRALNRKAARISGYVDSQKNDVAALDVVALDVVALQDARPTQSRPHIPTGCALMFSPGWEVDAAGGTAGLCQPVERDIYDCFVSCYWPAQVPDHLNNSPNWASKCAAATKDWRNLDLIFP